MIGNQDINVDSWQALVNRLLDLPSMAQFAINEGMQLAREPVDRKHEPMFRWAIIPNVKNAALGIAQDILTELLKEWMRPNIGGIVINATKEVQGRQVDISENMIIVQGSSGVNREYNTDNSAPHLRTWNIEGHLTQALPYVDENFILRPTLVMQQIMIDAYAASRRPVLYRSALCPIPTQVLIEDYSIGRVVEGNNAYTISISLKEFVTYKVPFYHDPDNQSSDTGSTGDKTATAAPPPSFLR